MPSAGTGDVALGAVAFTRGRGREGFCHLRLEPRTTWIVSLWDSDLDLGLMVSTGDSTHQTRDSEKKARTWKIIYKAGVVGAVLLKKHRRHLLPR